MIDVFLNAGDEAQIVTSGGFVGTGALQNVYYTGASVGDLLVVFAQPGFGPLNFFAAGGAAWNVIEPWGTGVADPYGYISRIGWKVISPGDILDGRFVIELQGGQPGWYGIYKGASTVAVVQSNQGTPEGGGSLGLSGVTPTGNAVAMLALLSDRDAASGGAVTPPALGGLVERIDFSAGFFALAVFDFLAIDDYPVSTLTFTGFSGTTYQWGHLVELRK
jgi:hypothetical protein